MPVAIQAFLDYRDFLRAWLDAHPRTSLRALARRAGCSPSLLSRIVARERDLEPSRVPALAVALRLGEDEARYLADLVDLESTSRSRRQTAWARVSGVRRYAAAATVRDDAVRLFTHWAYGAIWQLARCGGFRDDVDWIRGRLRAPVSEYEVRDAIDALLALGLLARDAAGACTAVPEDRVTLQEVPRGALADALRSWHAWHLRHIEACLRRVPASERKVSGITVAVGPAELEQVLARIRAFELELAALAAESVDPDRVYQLEIGFVPLSSSTRS